MLIVDGILKKVEDADIINGFFAVPVEVKVIGKMAFCECNSLTNIVLHENITQIREYAFEDCNNLEKLTTPWGINNIKKVNTKEIYMNYLFLFANSVLKDKYENIESFLSNPYILELVNHPSIFNENNNIEKFKNIFYKLRKKYDINPELFMKLSLKTTEKFNLDSWNKIKKILYFNKLHEDIPDIAELFSYIIEIFGLFERDTKKKERIEKLKEIISNNPCIIRKDDLVFDKHFIDTYFNKVNTTYFILKNDKSIPREFELYLTEVLSEEKRKNIKHLTGNYGSRINNFIKENYKRVNWISYELKEDFYNDKEVKKQLFIVDIPCKVNYHSLSRIFDRCQKEFDKDFYDFFIENLIFILDNKKIQSNIKNIQANFKDIKKHYSYSGVEKITLKQAMDYLENQLFDYHDGNYELSLDVKKAGVNDQVAFDFYQQIFEQNNVRKQRSLIRRINIYEVDRYTIKAELLRKDDSFSMLVGETNYTNCCQVFGGIGHNCLAHATSSDDGGIFVTKLLKDGEEILLTQSWDWQNNNVYCHDNIEVTPYLKNNPALKKAVAKVFELDGNYIIEKSKQEVENYIKTRKKIVEKSLSSEKEKLLKELNELEKRELIRLVTVGAANDGLGASNYFKSSIDVIKDQLINGQIYRLENFQPVNYNKNQPYFNEEKTDYNDSYITQYIIAGSIENLCLGKNELLVPIYRDERRIVHEENEQIRNYTTKKIKDIEKEVYPESMLKYQNYSQIDFKECKIYLGEDWYLIYEEKDEKTIYISDLAKIEPNISDEKTIQIEEIIDVVYDLVKKYDIVEVDLKTDTSYLLFLINKKLGYVEQIGEDISYKFDNNDDQEGVTDEKQQEILKIREGQNPQQTMHKIFLKKGKYLASESQKVLKKLK